MGSGNLALPRFGDEPLVRRHGIHLVRCSLPIQGTLNVYFVKAPLPTIIDVPAQGGKYIDELDRGLRAAGSTIRDVKRIIITHPHFDHYGSAQEIVDQTGAELWVFQEGTRWIERCNEELDRQERYREKLLVEAGAPPSDVELVSVYYRKANRFAAEAKPSRLLWAGETFELGNAVFSVLPVPGHTPFCILLHDTENRVAFTGDFLPFHVSGAPLVQWKDTMSTMYRTTMSYVSSLRKVRTMNLKLALPGHGAPIKDPSKRIDRLLTSIEKRRAGILKALEDGGRTPYQIALRLFPEVPRESLFRMISDVIGQLEMLECETVVQRSETVPTVFSLFPRVP